MISIYVIGSLRNPAIPEIAKKLRGIGLDAFDDWFSAGPEADDKWRDYEINRGRAFGEALGGISAQHVFNHDKKHLDRCDLGLLVLPAGRSGHLELGYIIGQGKPGYILHDNPERWDVMYGFASGVFTNEEQLIEHLRQAT